MDQLFKQAANTVPKILAVGKNYPAHVKEMGMDKPPDEPLIFLKPTSSIFHTYSKTPFYLHDIGNEIHHEIELGVVISKQGKNIQAKNYQEFIGGYFLCLDLTDRIMQGKFKKLGFSWELSKGQDNFLPISQFVEAAKVNDPHNLELQLNINQKVVQQDNTGSMFFKIPFLIEFISKHMTLNQGDLILTGTPHGVGPIKKGDYVEGALRQDNGILADFKFLVE